LAVEVTLQPLRAFEVDAAILFADILLPLEPMNAPFDFTQDDGPVIRAPLRNLADVERLRVFDAEELGHVLTAVRLLRGEIDGKTPLIGFAGGPFTMASYLIEGGRSTHFQRTKRWMHEQPEAWALLMQKLSEVVRRYLRAQFDAGAQALQIFDSWAGTLTCADYAELVAPHLKPLFADLEQTGVPVIHFSANGGHLLEQQRDVGGTVLGIGFQTPLCRAAEQLGPEFALQGNLDPTALLAPRETLKHRVDEVLEGLGRSTGHIFNLGHGILPETNPSAVSFVVDRVHARGLS
jgi:uroporphyrinogen decarboxylase